MREGSQEAPGPLQACDRANLVELLPETGRNPTQFARRLAKCCERRALCGKAHAREHNKPPGFSPSLPHRDRKAARRAEPGGADANHSGGADANHPGGADARKWRGPQAL
jgi:hypothetical protein